MKKEKFKNMLKAAAFVAFIAIMVALFRIAGVPLVWGLPSFPDIALADVISDDIEWGDNLVLSYTASNGEEYRMLCDEIFVAGPYTAEDKVPLSLESCDFDASYREVGDQAFFSEWWGEERDCPVVHALQLRKVHGQVVSISRRYLAFQNCEIANATEADIAAYLKEHPLEVKISLDTDQEKFGYITGSHTVIPE